MHSSDVNKLKLYVEKIENLEAEKVEIQENISDVFKQAKADGFDVKIMKKVIKLKKMKTELLSNLKRVNTIFKNRTFYRKVLSLVINQTITSSILMDITLMMDHFL